MPRIEHTVVFADGGGGGNPCPVVFGAGGWDGERMRALAEEFGHETAFVLEPQDGGDARLRYFVPRHEMEMCVHATVAAAVLLARDGLPISRLETPLGIRRVQVDAEAGTAVVEQFPPEFSDPLADSTELLSALGAPDDAPILARGLRAAALPVQAVSTARAKLMVPLVDEAALDALRPDVQALWALCRRLGVSGAYPFTLRAVGADVAARQFPVDAGYDEDPATGVAACGLAAYLAHHLGGGDGWHSWTVAQGRAMGRPSLLTAEARLEGGAVVETRVGGAMRALSR